MDVERLLGLFRALHDEGVRYKVIGGVAMNLHGLARATRDVDVFIAADEDNVARLQEALMAVFADESIREITAEDLQGDYPAIQYSPPTGGFHIDILARLGEAFDYESLASERLEVRGIPVEVVTLRQLLAMKADTVRPRDALDAAWLRARLQRMRGDAAPDEEG